MTTDSDKLMEGCYVSENGRVRAYYRKEQTAEDQLYHAMVVGRYLNEEGPDTHRAYVRLKVISEFALSTFTTRVELLDEAGAVVESHPFTMDLLKKLTGPYADGAWAMGLALEIHREVIDKTTQEVAEVKKTSENASTPLSESTS